MTDTFVTLLLSGLRLALRPSEMVYQGYSVFGLFLIVIPIVSLIAKIDHERVDLSL